MNIKRALAILLCISLIMLTVAGCGSNDDDEYYYENGDDTTPERTPDLDFSFGSSDPLEEAEEILRLLNARVGTDNFIEFFREMMLEHSEDPGSHSFPEGYVFREGDMVPEFFEAAISLEYGEISGIVETMYGYHIILRVPVDYDSAPMPPPGAPPSSLRQLAAMEDFRFQYSQWLSAVEANIEYSPEYEALDLAIIFEHGTDFELSFPSFNPDTIMISSGDLSIPWAHLYVFLFPIITEILESHEAGNMEVEWHEEAFEGYTLAELVIEYATDEAISFIAYLYGMEANNIILSDDDLSTLDESIDGIIAIYGSKEDFEESLRENSGYYDFETFMDFAIIEFGVSALVEALYGDEGSGFPDARVAQYAEANGFLMAMHILRMKPGF